MPDFLLDTPDQGRIRRIMGNIRQFNTQAGKQSFVESVLEDVVQPSSTRLGNQIDGYDADRQTFADRLWDKFVRFGTDQPNRLVIVPLLLRLKAHQDVPNEDRAFIEGLFAKYPILAQGRLLSTEHPQERWRGGESVQQVQQEVFEEDTLFEMATLRRALNASHAVVLIENAHGSGTGFFIGARHILTCHHVVNRSNWETTSLILHDEGGRVLSRLGVDQYGITANASLDYAVLTIFGDVQTPIEPLRLPSNSSPPNKNDRLFIIHHPEGGSKKISMTNNFVRYADHTRIQYTTLTQKGSSGAPLLNAAFNVLGIHQQASQHLPDPSDGKLYSRQQGISIHAITQDLQQHHPTLWTTLQQDARL